MQSRTSFFNLTLFRKNLSRFWPLWGAASLAGSMVPLVLALNLMGSYHYILKATDMQEMLYATLCYGVPIITLFYAILVATMVWSYLYNARSVGLMHTLPIDRGSLFLTSLASGLAMLLIPYVITGGLVILICIFNGCLPVAAVLETIVGVIGHAVFYFGTATLCAMVTGNLFALPCFYFIGHFFFIVLYWMLSQFASNFIFGFSGDSAVPEWVQFLTPTVNFYEVMDYDTHYNETTHVIESVTLEGLWLIGVYALIGIALLFLSYYLYTLRHSESAGDVVAFGWLKPIFRYGVAVCSALTLGQVLYELLWQIPFQSGSYYQIVPMCLCMIAAGLIGYYVASMLLAKSLRVFRRSLGGVATVSALVVLICACVSLDVFGVASNLPDKDKVDTVRLTVSGESLNVPADNPFYDEIVALNESIIADEAYIRANDDTYRYGGYSKDANYVYVRFYYDLHSGDTIRREYRVPLTRERWEREHSSYDYQINHLLNDSASIALRLNGDISELSSMWVYLYAGDIHTKDPITGPALKNIWQAMLKDADEGNFMAVDLISGSPKEDIGSVDIEFRRPNASNNGYYHDYNSFSLNIDMKHTLRALVDNGIFTAEQYQELLTLNWTSSSKEVLTSFPESESIEIIGGADGPTTVFVTTEVS